MIPNGYLKVNHRLSTEEARRIRGAWESYVAEMARGEQRVMVLDNGIEFVPFDRQAVPDAFCKYCASPNLTTSAWCSQCGAPLLRAQ